MSTLQVGPETSGESAPARLKTATSVGRSARAGVGRAVRASVPWLTKVGRAIRELMYRQVPELPPVDPAGSLSTLPPMVVNPNWKAPAARMPHMLIHNLGEQIDEVAADFVTRLNAQERLGTAVTVAGEMDSEPGVSRPLRVVHRIQRGHIVATDVLMRREGDDLYVRFATRPRTALTYLRRLWLSGIFLAAMVVLLGGYLMVTGARTTWAKDYAEKHAPLLYPGEEKTAFLTRRILSGWYATDWTDFRRRLREKPELMKKVKSSLQSLAAEQQNDARQQSENSQGLDMVKLGMGQLYSMAASMDEFAPDFLAQKLLENRNADEYAYLWSRDELHDVKALGMTAAKRNALFTSEQVEAVDLGNSMASFFEKDPETSKELLTLYDKSTTWHGGWSLPRLFFADPRAALSNFGMPVSLLAAAIGFWVWRSPLSWLRFPCRRLGWIMPDDFNSYAVSRMAGVKRVFTAALGDRGVGRDQIDELGAAE